MWLCVCIFPNTTSSLPTCCNWSPSTPAQVWQCCIQYLHYDSTTSLWIIVYYIFSQLVHHLGKPAKWPLHLIFEPHSTFICIYTRPAIILVLVNVGNSACPLVNSIVKIMVLWQLSQVGIRGNLLLKRLTFLTTAISKLKTINDTNYNHLIWDTLDALIQIDCRKQQYQLPNRIYYESLKAAEQWSVNHARHSSTWPIRCVVSSTHTSLMICMVCGPYAPTFCNCSIYYLPLYPPLHICLLWPSASVSTSASWVSALISFLT